MILLTHYMLSGFTNGYILAAGPDGPACIINPGSFDTHLLDVLEAHRLYLRSVLITTPEPQHTRGIETLLRIYDARVFAASPIKEAVRTEIVEDGSYLDHAGLQTRVIALPESRPDAVAYSCGHYLFPGNVLQAGTVMIAEDTYQTIHLRAMVRQKLLSLPEATVVLPSVGPPTTVGTELRTNIDVTRGY